MKKAILILVGIIVIITGAALYFFPAQDTKVDIAELTAYAQTFCERENITAVSLSRTEGLIRVDSALLGGGATYYRDPSSAAFSCPVVGPDAMSDMCKEIIAVTDWEVVCTPAPVLPTAEDAAQVAESFFLDVLAVAPSESTSTAAAETLYGALATQARTLFDQDAMASSTASFVGIQDVPDEGVDVVDTVLQSDSEAVVTVRLNYSGGAVQRDVHLVVEEGVWKVARVTPSAEAASFEQAGNLVRNNPGMERNVWYLVYEAPGKPALNTKLRFASSSICAEGVENSTCVPDELTTGSRVRVLGNEDEDDTVQVVRLEILN